MPSTKEKILLAALKLFNTQGIANVRLQHIADEAFISVGNLAYHYANKEAIVTSLYERLRKKQQELLIEYRTVPLFDNINHLLKLSFLVQQEFVFFYLDTLEIMRVYPEIGATHQKHIEFQIAQINTILSFNVARGALVSEYTEEDFSQLAKNIWSTMDGWYNQQAIRNAPFDQSDQYEGATWSLLRPYFTDMGKREFEQMRQMPYQFPF